MAASKSSSSDESSSSDMSSNTFIDGSDLSTVARARVRVGAVTALQLRSKDAAIISLEYKTAFPDPVHKVLDAGTVAQSAYVNL